MLHRNSGPNEEFSDASSLIDGRYYIPHTTYIAALNRPLLALKLYLF